MKFLCCWICQIYQCCPLKLTVIAFPFTSIKCLVNISILGSLPSHLLHVTPGNKLLQLWYLSHPVKNSPPSDIKYLCSCMLAVLFSKKSNFKLECRWVCKVLSFLLHVLIFHPFHIQLIFPSKNKPLYKIWNLNNISLIFLILFSRSVTITLKISCFPQMFQHGLICEMWKFNTPVMPKKKPFASFLNVLLTTRGKDFPNFSLHLTQGYLNSRLTTFTKPNDKFIISFK